MLSTQKNIFTALLLLPQLLQAEGLSGSVELGFINTSGSTETQSTNFKASVENDTKLWHQTGSFEALGTSANEAVTAEKYLLKGQNDYKVIESGYLFANASYDKNRFSGYTFQLSEALGYGHNLLKQETKKLDLEAGLGLRQSQLDGVDADGKDNDTENEVIFQGALKFKMDFSKTSSFSEELTTEIGETLSVTRSVTALSAQVAGNLSAKFAYTVKYSAVKDADSTTDTEAAVTLVYSF